MNSTKSINVQYFAVFREQRGLSVEQRTTTATTLRELYAELKNEHGFSLSEDRVRAAINDEFAPWETQLVDDAKVVFIPPVAGG